MILKGSELNWAKSIVVSKAFTKNASVVEMCRLATYNIIHHYILDLILKYEANFEKEVL